MRLGQRDGTHDSVGVAFRPLGVALGQISEVGFTGFDLQVELARQKAVLQAQQAVNHLIQFVLAFQETASALAAKRSRIKLRRRMLWRRRSRTSSSLRPNSPAAPTTAPCRQNHADGASRAEPAPTVLQRPRPSDRLTDHHLLHQGLEQIEASEQSPTLNADRSLQLRNHRSAIHSPKAMDEN